MQTERILKTIADAKADAEKIAKNHKTFISSTIELFKGSKDQISEDQKPIIEDVISTFEQLKDINKSVDIEALTKKAEQWKKDLS